MHIIKYTIIKKNWLYAKILFQESLYSTIQISCMILLQEFLVFNFLKVSCLVSFTRTLSFKSFKLS